MDFKSKVSTILKRDIIILGCNFLLSIFAARYLGPSGFGIWVVIQLLRTWGEAIFRLKLDVASVYFYGKRKISLYNLVKRLAAVSLVSITLLSLTSLLFLNDEASQLLPLLKKLNTELFFVSVFIIALNIIYMAISHIFLAISDMRTYSLVTITYSGLNFILGATLLLLELGIWSMLASTIIGMICASILGIFCIPTKKLTKNSTDVPLSEILKYALQIYLAGNVLTIQATASNMSSAMFLNTMLVGTLGLANTWIAYFSKILDALNTVLYPYFSNHSRVIAALHAVRSLRCALILLVVFGFASSILLHYFVSFIFGVEFLKSVIYFDFLLIGAIPYLLSNILTLFFIGTGRSHLPHLLSWPIALFSVSLCMSLAWGYGISGVIYATIASNIIHFSSFFILFIRLEKLNIKIFIPRMNDIKDIINFMNDYFVIPIITKIEFLWDRR